MITKSITNSIGYEIKLEPTVFTMAERHAPQYTGGYWQFHKLSNSGFYMSPSFENEFDVFCENDFEGKLSPDAFGITSYLYAFSHLSFGEDRLAQVYADQYHLLREYLFEHPKASSILQAID